MTDLAHLNDEERREWEKGVRYHPLFRPEDYGAIIESSGRIFRIRRYKPKNRKYPVILDMLAGRTMTESVSPRRYKVTISYVQPILEALHRDQDRLKESVEQRAAETAAAQIYQSRNESLALEAEFS